MTMAIVTAATGDLALSPALRSTRPCQRSGAAVCCAEIIMSDALKRAQRYRYLAKECRRLAAADASTQTQSHYRQMAEYDSELAEAEELSTLGHVNGD